MRVHLVDPAAYTPPYDHALAAAVAAAGAEAELITCRFPYGPVPRGGGYEVREHFYRRSSRQGIGPRRRRLLRAAEHIPDMRRYAELAEEADVVHYQWLPIPRLDRRLLAPKRPRVFTMHWRLPEAGSGIGRALSALLAEMDAIVVHSEHGAERLQADFGVRPERLEAIPHGSFDYLTSQPGEAPLPEELRAVEGPVVLAFGLVRPYKGTDVLIEAFNRVAGDFDGAELWVVGMPRMPMEPLREAASRSPGTVRFVERFVTDLEIPAFMRRADLVALPYRNIEQSGVLYTALAFGRPLLLSDVGGFGEIAATGAARLAPPGDVSALADRLAELLGDPGARREMADRALDAARGSYSWEEIGRRTVALYDRLLGVRDPRTRSGGGPG